MCFFLLSLLAYLGHAGRQPRRPERLALSLLFCLLALLAKPMAVTLPLVLLLLDWWPLRRLPAEARRAVLEKAPFLLACLLAGLVTLAAQSAGGAVATAEHVPASFRWTNAAHSVVLYLVQMILPVGLLPFYPIGTVAGAAFTPAKIATTLLVLLASAACLAKGGGHRAYLSAAWLYYLITLAPVLGIVQVGNQSHADRYTYLPGLAPLLLAGAGLAALPARAAAALGLIVACGLTGLTVRQIATWKDSVALWERVVAAYPDVSYVAHANMGNAYKQAGRPDEAIAHYRRALAIGGEHPYVHDGLGAALLDRGRVDEAIAELQRAVSLDVRYAKAHRNLWFAYERQGMREAARGAAEAAVRADPEFADAWSTLGIAYANEGRLAESERAFRRALDLHPGHPPFLVNLGTTLHRAGRFDEALALHLEAARRDPGEPAYWSALGFSYAAKGRRTEALEAFRRAQALGGRVDPALLR